jgi:hypothetical protein
MVEMALLLEQRTWPVHPLHAIPAERPNDDGFRLCHRVVCLFMTRNEPRKRMRDCYDLGPGTAAIAVHQALL